MGRRPKVEQKVLDRVKMVAMFAARKAEDEGVELRYPLIEDVMHQIGATPEDVKCLASWRENYPPDTRRRQLGDWGLLRSHRAQSVGRDVVRIVIPAALKGRIRVGGGPIVTLGRVVLGGEREATPDQRFPENYAVRITQSKTSEGRFELLIAPVRDLDQMARWS